MFSGIRASLHRTAAWKLALGSTLVFAASSAVVFLAMYALVAGMIRERSDSWLVGESETLRQVAMTTPRDALYDRIVDEVAEQATQEMAWDSHGNHTSDDVVFFAESGTAGQPPVWVGPRESAPFLAAIQQLKVSERTPASIVIPGWHSPFRVVAVDIQTDVRSNRRRIWLGLQDTVAVELLNHFLVRFFLGWICMVGFGFLITLLGLRRMLKRVDAITGTAASIRPSDLSTRVPTGTQQDEIARLARTFNTMLDRLSASVNQLRTLTDSVAHDLKSPITSTRGSLEIALSLEDEELSRELVAKAIENLDRLSGVITTSLDLAEAEGGALRLHVEPVDLADLAGRIAELYAPAFADKRQTLVTKIPASLSAILDVPLFTRLLSNLMENELRYAGDGARIHFSVAQRAETAVIAIEDDGPGFSIDLLPRLFQRFAKGSGSEGHGLGLAFVNAVAGAHGGRATALNRAGNNAEHGARIIVEVPLSAALPLENPHALHETGHNLLHGVTKMSR
jgi:signal transduction histidine kinase